MSRLHPVLTLLAAVALAAACWRVGLPRGDFANYWVSASLWAEGADLAQLYDYRWFTGHAERLGFGDQLVGFPVLTPPSVLFAVPLLPLGLDAGLRAWQLLQVLLAVVLALVSARAARLPGWAGVLGLAVAWPALHSHLVQGQFHLPAVLLVALGLWAWDRGRLGTAGAAWALAAGLKVFAWPLLLVVAATRAWRALAVAVLVLVAGALGSVVLVGWPLHATWLSEVAGPSAQGFYVDPWTHAFQSLGAAARRAWLPHPGLGDAVAVARPELAVGLPVFVATLLPLLPSAAALRWQALGSGAQARLLAAAALAALVGGPVLARYGLLLVVPPLLYALAASWRSGDRHRAVLLLVLGALLLRLPTPPAWPESSAFLGIPRFWLALALWGALLPWTRLRPGPALAAFGLALLAAVRAAPPDLGDDGAVALDHPDFPLVAAELVLGPDDALYFSGLSAERGDFQGRGWLGFRWDPAGTPERVAGAAGHHVWSPGVVGDQVQWGAEAAPRQCGDTPLHEVAGDLFLGERRLTTHPGRDRYPVCDPARDRVWFLSDRGVGVHALRLWWVPL